MANANPLRDPQTFDKLYIGGENGISNPGIFKLLDGGGRPYKWMINDPPGMQGAIVIYRGWRLSDNMKFQFQFWTADQIDQYYREFDPLLSYDALKFNPKPIVVFHPILNYSQINSVFIKEKGPLKDLGGQLWSVTHDVCEYRKPPKINVTSEAEEPNPRRPTVEDILDEEFAALEETSGVPIPGLLKGRPFRPPLAP